MSEPMRTQMAEMRCSTPACQSEAGPDDENEIADQVKVDEAHATMSVGARD